MCSAIIMLLFNTSAYASNVFPFIPNTRTVGTGNETLTPQIQTKLLSHKIVGVDLLWSRPSDGIHTINSIGEIGLEALRDFDLRSNLPVNTQDLNKLIRSRTQQQSLPLLLNSSDYFSGVDFHGHHLFSPTDKSETKVVGSVASAKVAVPERTLHMPVPKLGVLALRV